MKLKRNDLQTLHQAPLGELQAKLADAKSELTKLQVSRFKPGELKDLRQLKVTKRTIAQLNTLIAQTKGVTS